MDTAFVIKAFGAFFAILNPFLVLPIFLALTNDLDVAEQRRLAVKVGFNAAVLCIVLIVLGSRIIAFFGITVDQFRIAGGAVLAQIAWSMLNGRNIASHHGSAGEKDHMAEVEAFAFYPMTFPMIVGPGTIATIIIYTGQAGGTEGIVAVAGVVLSIIAMLFVVLYYASLFGRVLSAKMRTVITRLMGMILLAIAVEMVTVGLTKVLPGLASA